MKLRGETGYVTAGALHLTPGSVTVTGAYRFTLSDMVSRTGNHGRTTGIYISDWYVTIPAPKKKKEAA